MNFKQTRVVRDEPLELVRGREYRYTLCSIEKPHELKNHQRF